jgi:photosystem II stability/assembly factor-like uncharacterized protein
LTAQQSGTTNRLQAISPVNSRVVWASGLGGRYTVTTDGGETWHAGVVTGAENLQFRDVQAFSEKTAYLLSAGVDADSRIYKTEDGGQTWSLQFQHQNPNASYDCFAFWTPKRGITMADSVNGRFPVIRTTDGETWEDIGDHLPTPQDGEAAFAASGTCIATRGGGRQFRPPALYCRLVQNTGKRRGNHVSAVSVQSMCAWPWRSTDQISSGFCSKG